VDDDPGARKKRHGNRLRVEKHALETAIGERGHHKPEKPKNRKKAKKLAVRRR
jgi:hypothetical protein